MKQQKPRPVEEMRQEVARLRQEGLSFSQVAKELGISKAYAVKLSKSGNDRSLQLVTGHLGLSVRQRRFAKGLLEGKTQKQAALDAMAPGEKSVTAAEKWASRTVRDVQFQSEFQRMLARRGLSEERLAEVHAQNLQATKTLVASHEGKITDQLEVPDYGVRQRAVDSGWDLYARRKPEEIEQPQGPTIIYITQEKKEKLERMIGGPLEGPDIKVIDVPAEESGQAKPVNSSE